MTRDIIELNNFMVLIEESHSNKLITDTCIFKEEILGFAFYGSGDVHVTIQYDENEHIFNNTKGLVMSFGVNAQTEFIHKISNKNPLECVVIAIAKKNIDKLPIYEKELFYNYLKPLLSNEKTYVAGPNFYMNNEMMNVVNKIMKVDYNGSMRYMFLRSQVMELLSHFFAIISKLSADNNKIKEYDRVKLYKAQEIIDNNLEHPPSLTELSKLTGLNNSKLKKNFKEVFGLPVYKYLQIQRLKKAHDLLRNSEAGIQEAAWAVGYESISSFSNAFVKHFGFRPSQIKN